MKSVKMKFYSTLFLKTWTLQRTRAYIRNAHLNANTAADVQTYCVLVSADFRKPGVILLNL